MHVLLRVGVRVRGQGSVVRVRVRVRGRVRGRGRVRARVRVLGYLRGERRRESLGALAIVRDHHRVETAHRA
eukprot:scaffold1516_cov38-Phaeocystis_antarctica.AAC.3